ncbi:hypothetical protein, partial [Metabacillus bambusae]
VENVILLMLSPNPHYLEIKVYKKIPIDETLFYKCPIYRYHIIGNTLFLILIKALQHSLQNVKTDSLV